MSRARTACAVIAALALLVAPARGEVADREWVAVSSRHFDLLSRLPEEETRELARSLELFREVVELLTGGREAASPVPTRIIVLARPLEWREIGADSLVAGFYSSGLRANRIAMRDFQGAFGTGVVQHEYVHFVLRNKSRARYPRWYDEGFAELMATTKIQRGAVTVGGPPIWRFEALQHTKWIPMREIIDPEDEDAWTGAERSMFYSEAWALCHFLLFGDLYPDSFTRRLQEYVRRVGAGEDGREAFSAAFGISMKKIDRRVRRYLNRGVFPGLKIPPESLRPDLTTRVRMPTRAEVLIEIGDLQLVLREPVRAQASFEAAAALDPRNPRAMAGIGRALADRRRFAEAAAHFDAAVRAAPEDPVARLDRAGFLLDRAGASIDEEAARAGVLRARGDLVAAWQLDPGGPEAYALYGWSFLLLGDDPAHALETLEHAERLVPSDLTVRGLLAEAYLAAGRDEDAERTARTVLAWSRPESLPALRARDVLGMLEAIRATEGPGAPAPTR